MGDEKQCRHDKTNFSTPTKYRNPSATHHTHTNNRLHRHKQQTDKNIMRTNSLQTPLIFIRPTKTRARWVKRALLRMARKVYLALCLYSMLFSLLPFSFSQTAIATLLCCSLALCVCTFYSFFHFRPAGFFPVVRPIIIVVVVVPQRSPRVLSSSPAPFHFLSQSFIQSGCRCGRQKKK